MGAETEEYPNRVDKQLAGWRQGDCVLGEMGFLHRFDPGMPLTEDARDVLSVDPTMDVADVLVRGCMVATQTGALAGRLG